MRLIFTISAVLGAALLLWQYISPDNTSETSLVAQSQFSTQSEVALAQSGNIKTCDSSSVEIEPIQQLEAQRKAQIKTLLQNLPEHLRTASKMAMLAEMAGLERLFGINLLPKRKRFEPWLSDRMPADAIPLDKTQIAEVNQLIEQSDFLTLSNRLAQGEIPKRAYIRQKSLLQEIMDANVKVDDSDLALLLESGLVSTKLNLIKATRQGVSTDTLALMHQHSKRGVLGRWYQNGRFNSLATEALSSLNPSAFEYWFNQGARVWFDQRALSWYDEDLNDVWAFLPTPTNAHEQTAALEIFDILVANGYSSTNQFQYDKLSKWLPQEKRSQLTIEQPQWFDESVMDYLAQVEQVNKAVQQEIDQNIPPRC